MQGVGLKWKKTSRNCMFRCFNTVYGSFEIIYVSSLCLLRYTVGGIPFICLNILLK